METLPEILSKLDYISGEDSDEFLILKKELIRKVSYMLDNQADQLFNFFYRFDLDERAVKSAVFNPEGESSASILSDLIIKRAIEKLEMRKRYS